MLDLLVRVFRYLFVWPAVGTNLLSGAACTLVLGMRQNPKHDTVEWESNDKRTA